MKKILMASLLAAQLVPASQAAAAEFVETRATSPGAFAGLRLRVALDPQATRERVRAGLAVAPALETRDGHGNGRTRIGEGLELGFTGDAQVRLSIAGTPISRMAPGGEGPDGRRTGVSTLGWVVIGAGALLVVGLGVGYLVLDEALDCDEDEECN